MRPQDEMRLGQKNGCVRRERTFIVSGKRAMKALETYIYWAKKGSRPRQLVDQRYDSAYVFGAVCPSRDTGVALLLPDANTEAMQRHLDEIAKTVATGAHAVLLLDNAAWHKTKKLAIPENISLLFIPPASPELNPVENIWQYLRQTYLSNRVFETYDAIVEAGCAAWNKLLAETGRIASIATRTWVTQVDVFAV